MNEQAIAIAIFPTAIICAITDATFLQGIGVFAVMVFIAMVWIESMK